MENKSDTIVLVVDDEQDIRDASERILTRDGFQTLKASRGDEGLDILTKEKASIVLLDLKMPGMDGLEVLERIREMDEDEESLFYSRYDLRRQDDDIQDDEDDVDEDYDDLDEDEDLDDYDDDEDLIDDEDLDDVDEKD